jgi:hypothetical protein
MGDGFVLSRRLVHSGGGLRIGGSHHRAEMKKKESRRLSYGMNTDRKFLLPTLST